jgi:hypothetical protein
MKVMVLVKATPESETGKMPSQELFEEMTKFNEALAEAGIIKMGEGLHPTSAGYRVRFSGKQRTVTQGPFEQINELVAGFWLWEVKSMEEAIEWVKRCPNPMESDSDIEIRRLYEMHDFADVLSDDLQEREQKLRTVIEDKP